MRGGPASRGARGPRAKQPLPPPCRQTSRPPRTRPGSVSVTQDGGRPGRPPEPQETDRTSTNVTICVFSPCTLLSFPLRLFIFFFCNSLTQMPLSGHQATRCRSRRRREDPHPGPREGGTSEPIAVQEARGERTGVCGLCPAYLLRRLTFSGLNTS